MPIRSMLVMIVSLVSLVVMGAFILASPDSWYSGPKATQERLRRLQVEERLERCEFEWRRDRDRVRDLELGVEDLRFRVHSLESRAYAAETKKKETP